MHQDCCTHFDEDRYISGTWVFNEFHTAIDLGYSLGEVFEFWGYEVTCYEKTTNSGLFARYVNIFLKLKQEASGYRSWVQSEEDKDRYIEDYRRAEGISLDKAAILRMQDTGTWLN
jgi:hypothetical protein